jgi:hypothetical protein
MGRVDQAGRLHVYVLEQLPPGEYQISVEVLTAESPAEGSAHWMPSLRLKQLDPALVECCDVCKPD